MVRSLACCLFAILAITTAFPQQQLGGVRQRQSNFRQSAPPARNYEEEERLRPKVYETRHQIALPNKGDGKYKYYAEYSDGLKQEQEGFVHRPNPSAVKEGSYTTFDENGQVVTIDYIADKRGFQPANLPQPQQDTEENQRAREEILSLQKEIAASRGYGQHHHQPANLPQVPQDTEENQRARAEILKLQKEIRDEHLGHLRAGYNPYGK